MFYLDSQRTVTRRDSSLLTELAVKASHTDGDRSATAFTAAGQNSPAWTSTTQTTTYFPTETNKKKVVLEALRPWGTIRNEIITSLFENMIQHIVDKWEVIDLPKVETAPDPDRVQSEVQVTSKKKKNPRELTAKHSRTTRRSRSKLEQSNVENSRIVHHVSVAAESFSKSDPLYLSWWSAPDEKAIIHFKNGNTYEGHISMKCMNGEGRYVWKDGTVYLGLFENNKMTEGTIHWRNETWYQGKFLNNIRHGHGMFCQSRNGNYYTGEWYNGLKHGKGEIRFGYRSTYYGDWNMNVREGFGIREYCLWSGYKGEWVNYKRQGSGVMIWPRHDYYNGEWNNGLMEGYGLYIWDICHNNTMASPCMNTYRGNWSKGARQGYGVLKLGLGLGAHYDGNFENNKKHGQGILITNNGYRLESPVLYQHDIMGSSPDDIPHPKLPPQPIEFQMCDASVGLRHHIRIAIENFDMTEENRKNIVGNFIKNNEISNKTNNDVTSNAVDEFDVADFYAFEEASLRKSVGAYESDLEQIYYDYAIMCCTEPINFRPILIRLYLWQFLYDIKLDVKGISLVKFDECFHENRKWLSQNPHDPFENIYFWQFVQCLLLIAVELHAKKCAPGPKPEALVADAFRTLFIQDILPNVRQFNGSLRSGFAHFVPLHGLYKLYKSIGEPHTIRDFLCAVNHSPHTEGFDFDQPEMVTPFDECLLLGHNLYMFGDDLIFFVDEIPEPYSHIDNPMDLLLFNLNNVPTRKIIQIFASIFPQILTNNIVMNLDVKMTFFEFFEAFIQCSQTSIRIVDEELRIKEMLEANSTNTVGDRTLLGKKRSSLGVHARISRGSTVLKHTKG